MIVTCEYGTIRGAKRRIMKGVILCIDDEEIILNTLKRELREEFGAFYDIELARNQEDALHLVGSLLEEGVMLPVALADYVLASMSGGIALLQEIHRRSPTTKNILLTGQISAEGIAQAVNAANLYRFIPKPWNKHDLILTVKEAIHSYYQEFSIHRKNEQLEYLNQTLQEYAKTLEQKVAERTQELHQAVKTLEEANQRLTQEIAERKQAEYSLQTAKKNLEALFNASADALIVTDVQGGIVDANPQAAAMFGYAKDELLRLRLNRLIHPAHAECVELFVRNVKADGMAQAELLHIREDGSPFYVNMRGSLVEYNASEHLLVIMHDSTERKRTEEELSRAKDAAESANRAKSEFLANMSHELRTPLNAILGYAQIFQRDPALVEQYGAQIDTIHRSGQHLLLMINDILDLSKIEAERLELELVPVNLLEFLNTFVKMIQIKAQSKGIEFRYELRQPLPQTVVMDERRLRQVLLNLLGNAIKFTELGWVALRVFTTPAREKDTTRICFEVQDTGIGIASDELQRIFRPFHQAGNRLLRGEGTGLGLTISQRLVQLMGSDIQVHSLVGEGSRFWFELTLPRSQYAAKESIAPLTAEFRHVNGFRLLSGVDRPPFRILVADDQKANRDVLTTMLRSLNFDVSEADNGFDALHVAQIFKPDVIFLDIIMPIMDGFEFIHHIRNISELKQAIIIVVSASVFEQNREDAVAAGGDDFLSKPVQFDALLECLQRHLQIEWRYDSVPAAPAALQVIRFPSLQTLEQLRAAAFAGDLTGIETLLDTLKGQEASYLLFIEQIEHFLQRFEFEQILQFLSSGIEGSKRWSQ